MSSSLFFSVCGAPPKTTSTEPITSWSVGDVSGWLEELGLGEHATSFAKASVDGQSLSKLTEADLEMLLLDNNVLAARKVLDRRDVLLRQGDSSQPALSALPSAEVESLRGQLASALAHIEVLKSGSYARLDLNVPPAKEPAGPPAEDGLVTSLDESGCTPLAAQAHSEMKDAVELPYGPVAAPPSSVPLALSPSATQTHASPPDVSASFETPPALGVDAAAPAAQVPASSAGVVGTQADDAPPSSPSSVGFLESLVHAASSAISDLSAALVGTSCYNLDKSVDAAAIPTEPETAAPLPPSPATEQAPPAGPEAAAPSPPSPAAAPAPPAEPAEAHVSNIASLAARAHALAASAEKALAAAQLEALRGGGSGRATPEGQNALARVLQLQAALDDPIPM